MSYLDQNKTALSKFKETYKDIRGAFDTNSRDANNYLFSILKYVCSECGKNNITANILNFFGYEANAKCWECQHK